MEPLRIYVGWDSREDKTMQLSTEQALKNK